MLGAGGEPALVSGAGLWRRGLWTRQQHAVAATAALQRSAERRSWCGRAGMMKCCAMIPCLLVMSMAQAQPPASSGQASCNQIDKEGRYHVAWNLSSSPRSYYRVQRFVPDGQTWRNLWTPVTTPYGTSETGVDG